MTRTCVAIAVAQLTMTPAVDAVEPSSNQISVTATADNPGGDVLTDVAGCSLREAVESFNTGVSVGGCTEPGTEGTPTIVFTSLADGSTLLLDGQELTVDTDLALDASTVSGVTINAQGSSRILNISPGYEVHLNQVSMTNGNADGEGDGFAGMGGAIYLNGATLQVHDSTLSNNQSNGYGGGAVYAKYSNVQIFGSTLSNNTAGTGTGPASFGSGGAIYLYYGSYLSLVNSTVSGNSAERSGAIQAQSPYGEYVALFNTTIARNQNLDTEDELRVSVYVDELVARNSIIGDTTGGMDCYTNTYDFDATTIVEDGSCYAPRMGDPGLESLSSNGGPTRTHALRSASIARDTGVDCRAVDQRGEARDDGLCDVGAFEFKPGDGGGGFNVIPLPNNKIVVIPE